MTVPLEHLGEYGPVQRNFDRIAALAISAGDESANIRFGTATVSWPGGTPDSSSLNVSHGLGTTPVCVVATAAPGAPFLIAAVTGVAATTFTLRARMGDGSSPAAATEDDVFWLAVG